MMEEDGILLPKSEDVSCAVGLNNDHSIDTNDRNSNFEASSSKAGTALYKESEPRSSRSQSKVFKSFEERLEELKSYKSMHGDCRVPSKYEINPSMAAWCANLKQSYRLIQQGKKPILKLSQEKINTLEAAGFEWKCSGRGQKPTNLFLLSGLKTEENRTPPQKEKKDYKERITSIQNTTDSVYIEKMNSSLDNIGAPKTKGKKNDQTETQQAHPSTKRARGERTKSKSFDEWIEELKAFKARHGHCKVSRNDSNHYSLGSWCHNMRGSYRITQKQIGNDILSKDRIIILNDIGFDWTLREPRQVKSFNERLKDLREFKQTYGHTRVPTGYEKNLSLAYWCNNLRNAYKMKETGKKQYISLSQERIDALKEVGFEFVKKSRKNNSSVDDDSIEGGDDCYYSKKDIISLEGGVGPIFFV